MSDQLIGVVLLVLAAGGVVGIALSMFRRARGKR
jgi:hypothetical protein